MQDYIITVIKEIRIDKQNRIYVKCQKGKAEDNAVYPEVIFLQTGIQFYYPKINDRALLYMPNRSIDVKYAYAVRFHNEKIDNSLSNGEGCVGILNNFISFLKTKLKFKSQEADFTEVQAVNFKEGGVPFLNQSATMKVVIAVGNSAGTYPVIIDNTGQTKVKG